MSQTQESERRLGYAPSGARLAGDRFQSLVFWQYASRMLQGKGIARVGFERSDVADGADDVVVWYDQPIQVGETQVLCECVQAKHHVAAGFQYEARELIKVGSGRRSSVFGRLFNAFRQAHSHDPRISVVLVTNSPANPECPVLSRVRLETGQLDLGAIQSGPGKMAVDDWRTHLGLREDDPLFPAFLSSLRFRFTALDKPDFLRLVALELAFAGYDSSDPSLGKFIDAYLTLVSESTGREFTRDSLLDYMRLAGFPLLPDGHSHVIGIRSYKASAQVDEGIAEAHLDFSDAFTEGAVNDENAWMNAIRPALSDLVDRRIPRRRRVSFRFDCHQSIAFTIGCLTTARKGYDATVVPRAWHGRLATGTEQRPRWLASELATGQGIVTDFALALSVTRRIGETVRQGLSGLGLGDAAAQEWSVAGTASMDSVQSLSHAERLAEEAAERLAALLSGSNIRLLHLFLAGPIELAFLLGHRWMPSMGISFQLYEFNKDLRRPGYRPSIVITP